MSFSNFCILRRSKKSIDLNLLLSRYHNRSTIQISKKVIQRVQYSRNYLWKIAANLKAARLAGEPKARPGLLLSSRICARSCARSCLLYWRFERRRKPLRSSRMLEFLSVLVLQILDFRLSSKQAGARIRT